MKSIKVGLIILLLGSVIQSYTYNIPYHLRPFHNDYIHHPTNETYRIMWGQTLLNLGATRFQENNLTDALAIFSELITVCPYSATAYHNTGYTLAELNRPQEAIKVYRQALELSPENTETHICLATALLACGDFKEGFKEYEWRWKSAYNGLSSIAIPVWQGEDLSTKTILLRSEGSFGDVLQFIRFAQDLKSRGATVLVHTLQPLMPLLSLCPYIDQLISTHDPIPTADYQHSLMSLPYLLNTTPETLPTRPYLKAADHLVESWHHITHDNNFKIGICWQADPHNDANRPLIAQRSIPLAACNKLTTIPHTSWYSLQAVDGTDQLADHPNIHAFGDTFDKKEGSFMDTAAIMMHLDLIITVDTSIAHLAGALGKRVWLMLPFKADWRWHYTGEYSCWYPTMKIFRKSEHGSWDDVLDDVYTTLIYQIPLL